MTPHDSTIQQRPAKPDPGFPLYPHKSGRWAKKIRGKTHFFGPWRDPHGALRRYLSQKDDLQAGCKPRPAQAIEEPTNGEPATTGCPDKPYPEFPLYAHKSGRWAKKIRGRTHFFGPWRDPHAALTRYLADKEDLEAGRPVQRDEPGVTDALTVERMVALFLEAKMLKVEAGEMEQASWMQYKWFGERMIRVFGAHTLVERLGPPDFQRYRADLQKTHKSLATIKSDLSKSRVFFNWAGPGEHGQGYIDRLPRFGDAFRTPSRTALERQREERGPRVFTAETIRALSSLAGTKLKAMILLGINCGYGNMDCVKLTADRLDLTRGWATFPRSKTATRRRNPLWPETVEALRAVLETRKPPRNLKYAKRVFITKYSQPFRSCAIGYEFEKLANKIGLTRNEANFYDLRRTCTSIGVQVKDDDAVRTITGHKRQINDMLGVYDRLSVSDDRLRAVTDHIHRWLFPPSANPASAAESGDGQPAAPLEKPE